VSDNDGVLVSGLVKRQFTAAAPNRLRVADFTYISTWAGVYHFRDRRVLTFPDLLEAFLV
jgi:transposase InsO family protein